MASDPDSSAPKGRKFSLVYREPGELVADSKIARTRIGNFVQIELAEAAWALAIAMGQELATEPASQPAAAARN